MTFGVVSTDAALSAASKVAGETRFSMDVRSQSVETLARMRGHFDSTIADIEDRRGVRFDLGPCSETSPAEMAPSLRTRLAEAAAALRVSATDMPSGAGHDALVFAGLGVPTAMLFIRNAHGSHNPREAMEIEDFAQAAEVLTMVLAGPE